LDAIKNGALKNELTKKYRTSDQDLALMLQPLYRQGRLTKDEFNSFFRGEALTTEPVEEIVKSQENPVLAASRHDAPTEMLHTSSMEKEPEASPALPPRPVVGDDVKLSGLKLVPLQPTGSKAEVPLRQDESKADESREREAKGPAGADSAGIAALLDMIFAKLAAIDDRLAQIEKKIG
jgi:hypothetical protein